MNSTLNPETSRRYFELRMPAFKWTGHAQNSAHCPFHDDANGSFSFNIDSGYWMCHAGCGSGGILDFEEKFSACDREKAKANVAALVGVSFGPEPEAIYTYRNALGEIAFRKLRYPGKKFVCQRPTPAGGWENGLEGTSTKPLYNLQAVVRAAYVVVVEGEKDADRLTAENLSQFTENGGLVAISTNFDGADAGKWRSEYNPYFAGKQVSVLPDNDPIGKEHALAVARGVHSFAAGVKIVTLPGLQEHQDVSDYLDSGHTVEDLIREIANTPQWFPDQAAPSRFKSVVEIRAAGSAKAEWVIPYFCERSATTSLSAKIKTGKSSLIMSGCKAVLTGGTFLGRQCLAGPVVMVSEMAGAALTAALDRAGLQDGEGLRILTPADAAGLTWPQIVACAVEESKRVSAVLLCVDTLNFFGGLMSDPDENSASKMLQVMRPLQEAANQGWAVLFAVHERKSGGSVGDCARGSSAIGGVADILMSLRRPEGNHPPTMRKIEVISRFPQTQDLVIDWGPDNSYSVVGTSDAAIRDRATQAILDALPFFADTAKTILVLQEETGETRTTIRRVLKELKATRTGTGDKGSPFKYHRREIGGSE
jgi:hypothetical protein